MIKKRYLPLVAALLSSSAMAGGDGKLLLLEAGFSFSHAFYKSSVVPPESIIAPNFLGGFAFDPSNHYPNDFWGGYIGASLYTGCWLLNTRYDMYDKEEQLHDTSNTRIHFSPVRLSFSVDKVWGDIHDFSGGLGLGAVIENLNKGTYYEGNEPGSQNSSTLDGRSRIDPLIEGFVMKNVAENVAIKLNVAYQFPAHNRTSNGDVNVNLGVNYAFPV